MSLGLNKIFWGLIVAFLDINIETIDILPDFFGYILIAYGFSVMKSMNDIESYANKGYIMAYALIALELIEIVIIYCFGTSSQVHMDIFGSAEVVAQAPNFFQMIIGVIPVIVVFMLDYYILKVIYTKGIEINNIKLITESKKYFNLLSLLAIANLIITPFLINYQRVDFVDISWSLLIISIFVVNILYITFVRKASKVFDQEAIQLEFKI